MMAMLLRARRDLKGKLPRENGFIVFRKPERTMHISFACNDPENGNFAGQTNAASYNDMDIESPGFRTFKFSEIKGGIRIHRKEFETLSSKDWYGNWCWNRYTFHRDEGKRLLATLKQRDWVCVGGPVRLCNWWDTP